MTSSVSTVTICETCAWSDGEKVKDGLSAGAVFAEAVEAAARGAEGVETQRFSCLMNCAQPCSATVAAPGKIGYALGRLEPTPEAAAALVAYAAGHASSDTGAVPYRTWPAGVKGKFVARIPATGAEPARAADGEKNPED